jgi:predicted nucleic acid-binding protein
MKRLKIYLDTSVISHLDAPDVPDREADTKRLWEEIRKGTFEVFISPVVMEELERCPDPKSSFLLEQLNSVQHTILQITRDVAELYARTDRFATETGAQCAPLRTGTIHMGLFVSYGLVVE